MNQAEVAMLDVVIRSLRTTLEKDMSSQTADMIVSEAINALIAIKAIL